MFILWKIIRQPCKSIITWPNVTPTNLTNKIFVVQLQSTEFIKITSKHQYKIGSICTTPDLDIISTVVPYPASRKRSIKLERNRMCEVERELLMFNAQVVKTSCGTIITTRYYKKYSQVCCVSWHTILVLAYQYQQHEENQFHVTLFRMDWQLCQQAHVIRNVLGPKTSS